MVVQQWCHLQVLDLGCENTEENRNICVYWNCRMSSVFMFYWTKIEFISVSDSI